MNLIVMSVVSKVGTALEHAVQAEGKLAPAVERALQLKTSLAPAVERAAQVKATISPVVERAAEMNRNLPMPVGSLAGQLRNISAVVGALAVGWVLFGPKEGATELAMAKDPAAAAAGPKTALAGVATLGQSVKLDTSNPAFAKTPPAPTAAPAAAPAGQQPDPVAAVMKKLGVKATASMTQHVADTVKASKFSPEDQLKIAGALHKSGFVTPHKLLRAALTSDRSTDEVLAILHDVERVDVSAASHAKAFSNFMTRKYWIVGFKGPKGGEAEIAEALRAVQMEKTEAKREQKLARLFVPH